MHEFPSTRQTLFYSSILNKIDMDAQPDMPFCVSISTLGRTAVESNIRFCQAYYSTIARLEAFLPNGAGEYTDLDIGDHLSHIIVGLAVLSSAHPVNARRKSESSKDIFERDVHPYVSGNSCTTLQIKKMTQHIPKLVKEVDWASCRQSLNSIDDDVKRTACTTLDLEGSTMWKWDLNLPWRA